MPKLDGMGVLREAARDALLARHGYIIMTALHRTETDELLDLRRHLRIDSATKPFDLDHLAVTVAEMAALLHAPDGPASPGKPPRHANDH
jgi:DNA-binding response OmpR family regulator